MKRFFRFRWLALFAPALLGAYGYWLVYDGNWLGAIYSSLRMYVLEMDIPESEVNVYIQIARWLAAAATTSVIVMVFQQFFAEIGLRWKLRHDDAVVVHGDGPRKETVVEALGKHAIPMSGNTCLDAKKHVLAFEDDMQAIRYLQEHEKKLLTGRNKQVYFSAYEYEPSDYEQQGLIVSNHAVNCARVYWKEHWLRNDAEQKIALIGCGRYAQRLLEQALLVNVIAWREPIEYHVFGDDGEGFRKWYPCLSNVLAIGQADPQKDSIIFHPDVQEDGIVNLQMMDRIIIAQDSREENILCLNKLLRAGLDGNIHVLTDQQLMQQLQYMPERQRKNGPKEIIVFGDDAELYSAPVIMHGELSSAAREAHIAYVRKSPAEAIRGKYGSCQGCTRNGLCGDCPQAARTWDDLTPFEKASNIASADHQAVKQALLEQIGQHGGMPAAKKELCRLEHERWCRFHYLHNWRYGPKRDDAARLHPSLVPFNDLSEAEQEKDWWAYSALLGEEA